MVQDGGLIKLIFGLKVKQLRQRKNLSLQEVAALTGISKSYLNEIENGKKYPKHDKIIPIAAALGCTYNDLVSTKLDKTLAPVMEMVQSDFFKEAPLELFGINKNNLIGIISEAPKQVTAFVNTLIEISKNYNLSKENFYFAVLRSFQELHDNYFEEIEEKATSYTSENHLSGNPKSDELAALLQKSFGYEIETMDFESYGAGGKLRSLFIPEKKLLLLNALLNENQKTFIYAKEIGFEVLQLNPRPHTYSWLDFKSFEELLHNYYASYFAGCLLIPKEILSKKIWQFFQLPEWHPASFDQLMSSFTDSPETFYYRLTNILPQDLGIKDLFYLCLTRKKHSDDVHILKELHLNQQQAPYANATSEHYCRRWVAIKNLQNLTENQTVTAAQISHYKDSGLSYLVISTSQKNPFSDGTNRSYCLGILLNSSIIKKINFLKNGSVPAINVGITCESCSILDCEVRQAPPVRLEKEIFSQQMIRSVEAIRQQVLQSS